MRYPLIGSAALISLFLALRFLPKHMVAYIITFYFCLVGVAAIGGAPCIHKSVPCHQAVLPMCRFPSLPSHLPHTCLRCCEAWSRLLQAHGQTVCGKLV